MWGELVKVYPNFFRITVYFCFHFFISVFILFLAIKEQYST